MSKLNKKIKFTGKIEIITGIHIGDSKENIQIGGVDSPIVRRKDNNQPYIPGSSLKGKMRCLLEQTRGAIDVGKNTEVNNLFGITENKKTGISQQKPSRLIFRDAYLNKDSANDLSSSKFTDYPFSEVKFENTIDRIRGTAGNPRKFERVPAGAIFDLEIILNVWTDENEDTLTNLLKEGIKLLNNDYLGGCGSRGYGQVVIQLEDPVEVYSAPA